MVYKRFCFNGYSRKPIQQTLACRIIIHIELNTQNNNKIIHTQNMIRGVPHLFPQRPSLATRCLRAWYGKFLVAYCRCLDSGCLWRSQHGGAGREFGAVRRVHSSGNRGQGCQRGGACRRSSNFAHGMHHGGPRVWVAGDVLRRGREVPVTLLHLLGHGKRLDLHTNIRKRTKHDLWSACRYSL